MLVDYAPPCYVPHMNEIRRMAQYAICVLYGICLGVAPTVASENKAELNSNWKIQSSQKTQLQGAEISSPVFLPSDWMSVSPIDQLDLNRLRRQSER